MMFMNFQMKNNNKQIISILFMKKIYNNFCKISKKY